MKRMGYAWKRGVFIVGAYVEIRGDTVQVIDKYGGGDFWYKKNVLSKPLKQIMNPRNEYEGDSSKW